jgi:nanoRNase/pAp phosphatase (c-di-AMP/oligoRNAs hydrolase)
MRGEVPVLEMSGRTTRSQQLLAILAEFDGVLVITHDNPDPDAIASGWAVCWLVHSRLGKPCRMIGGGGIVRAENQHMVRLLEPPIELVDNFEVADNTAAILVDCELATGNHLLSDSSFRPIGVIDHHLVQGQARQRLRFRDVRPRVAASASITASYLREQGLQPDWKLATALLYAVRTETQGGETWHSRLDRQIVTWLSEYADPATLAEIENAPLAPDYFADLALALQSTFVYGEAALCFLPQAHGAEIIGEVADLLIRRIGVKKVLCAAVVGGDLLLSVRTERGYGNAAQIVRRTLDRLGQGGGHEQRAGGKIVLARCDCPVDHLCDELRNRWLAACHIERQRGTRLVPRREIVRHL